MDIHTYFPRHSLQNIIAVTVLVVLVTSNIFSVAEVPKMFKGGWTSVDTDLRTWNTNETAPLGPGTNDTVYVVPSSITGLSLICNASYPIEWYFHREKWGRRTTWQIWVTTTRVSDPLTLKPISFSSELRFLGSDIQITGNYTCQAFGKPDVSSSVYVFWEGSGSPFLTLASSTAKRTVIFNNIKKSSFRLPCTTNRPDITVNLAKIFHENTTVVLIKNESITFNPAEGYTLENLPDPFGHYRCSVGDEEDEDFVEFEVISGDDTPFPEFNNTKWKESSFEYDSAKQQFKCCSSNNKPPKLANYECYHPITCRLRMHVLHKIESSSRRSISGNCAMIKLRGRNPGVLRCVGDSIDLVREYFFPIGVSRRWQSTNESVLPYYSWTDADPLKMMKLTNLSQPFYIGQQQQFDCQVSPFYYSQGIHWGIKYKNEKTYSIKGNQTRVGRRHPFELFMKPNYVYMVLTAEEGLESITCHAPVWNSTEWQNVTLAFDIKMPTKPRIDGPVMQDVDWRLNVTNQTLTCTFTGVPTPLIYWKKDNKTIYRNVVKGNGSSILTIPRVGMEAHGTYFCNVSNIGGFVTKTFNVNVSVGVSTEVVLLYVFAAFCILGAGIGGFFVVKKIKEQKEAIRRLANVAFKDVIESSASPPSQPNYSESSNPFPPAVSTNGNGFTNNGFLNNLPNNATDFSRYHKM